MAGLQFSASNLLQLSSALSPVLIAFFLLSLSLINQNIKGIIFIAGAILALGANLILMNLIKSPARNLPGQICSLVELPFVSQYNSPAPTSVFIMFTFAYMLLPMSYTGQMNYPLVIALLALYGIDGLTRIGNTCTTLGGVVLGGLVGGLLGAMWYGVFHMTGMNDFLYFDETASNRVMCNRPAKQTFKCSVYKGGKLVSSSIA